MVRSFIFWLAIYLGVAAVITAATVVIADMYFDYPFPVGLTIGLAVSAATPLIRLCILVAGKFGKKGDD